MLILCRIFLQNRPPQGYRPSVVKGRNQAPVRSPRSNGRACTFTEYPVDQGGGMPGFSDAHHSGSPRWKVHPKVNGSILQPNGVAESGSFWHIPQGTPLLESSRQPRPTSLLPQTSSQGLPTSGIQSPKAVVGEDENRYDNPVTLRKISSGVGVHIYGLV